jgi:alcohol dehydrogenase class IV
MTQFTFNTTRSIHQEVGGANRFGELAKNYLWKSGVKPRIMLVTDPGIVSLGLEKGVLASLKLVGAEVFLFNEVMADPPQATVLNAVKLAKEYGINAVVGFGGGSSMDVAKLVALLAISKQEIEEIYGIGLAKGERLPLAMIPTTAGTGSEVTTVSIVTTGEFEKKGVVSPLLLPDLALLDAELTLGLPPHTTATTGVDAMVHAIEAFTSKNANNNPISKILAKQALELLGANIREAVFNGSNIKARTNMLLGSMLAGQAFANSPVGAVHALAYPIGGLFHVSHGLSNALVLPHVLRFNADLCASQYAELGPIIFPELASVHSPHDVCDLLINKIASLSSELGLEATLTEVGIKSSDLDNLVANAMRQTRLLGNNPREVSAVDARDIYSHAL